MRRIVLLVALLTLACGASARAADSPPSVASVFQAFKLDVVIPQAWDGVWSVLDSTYDCSGAFQSSQTVLDTLCGGKDYSQSPGAPIELQCTGTADATTINMTCTGSYAIDATCTAEYTINETGALLDATHYHVVSIVQVTYSGTGLICSYLQPSCTQIDQWGTRQGAAPGGYCSTPARTRTWGRMKSIYR